MQHLAWRKHPCAAPYPLAKHRPGSSLNYYYPYTYPGLGFNFDMEAGGADFQKLVKEGPITLIPLPTRLIAGYKEWKTED